MPNNYVDNIIVNGETNDIHDSRTFSNVAFSGDYTGLINKPTIPTKTSDLTNDSGYITNSALTNYATKTELEEVEDEIPSLDGYATESWVEDQGYVTDVDLTAYQKTLIAGTNISIAADGRTISASGGGVSSIQAGQGTNAECFNSTEAWRASGERSHVEGKDTRATNRFAHAEGQDTTASGERSHAEGYYTTASGTASHAEGYYSNAQGMYAHAEGNMTNAKTDYQHAQGKYNVIDNDGLYADIVGNGTSSQRANISALGWDGNLHLKGNVYVGCNDDSTGGTMLGSGGASYTAGDDIVIDNDEISTIYGGGKTEETVEDEPYMTKANGFYDSMPQFWVYHVQSMLPLGDNFTYTISLFADGADSPFALFEDKTLTGTPQGPAIVLDSSHQITFDFQNSNLLLRGYDDSYTTLAMSITYSGTITTITPIDANYIPVDSGEFVVDEGKVFINTEWLTAFVENIVHPTVMTELRVIDDTDTQPCLILQNVNIEPEGGMGDQKFFNIQVEDAQGFEMDTTHKYNVQCTFSNGNTRSTGSCDITWNTPQQGPSYWSMVLGPGPFANVAFVPGQSKVQMITMDVNVG